MNVEVYGMFAFGVQVWGLEFRIEGLLVKPIETS